LPAGRSGRSAVLFSPGPDLGKLFACLFLGKNIVFCYNETMAKKGFTLIEVLIVVTLIGILVAILVPQYKYSVLRAREAVLKENLFQMRDAINKYYFDKKKYPAALSDLVSARYLRDIPLDPINKTREWQLVMAEPLEGEDFDPEADQGVLDVKSLSTATALDGTLYADW